MTKKRNLAVFPMIAVISLGMLAGCELLVDFDRTLIDGGSLGDVDSSFDGSETFDSAADAPATNDASDAANDSSTNDSGDAGEITDAEADADADM